MAQQSHRNRLLGLEISGLKFKQAWKVSSSKPEPSFSIFVKEMVLFQNNRKTKFALIAKRLVTHRDSSRKFVSDLKNMPSEKTLHFWNNEVDIQKL